MNTTITIELSNDVMDKLQMIATDKCIDLQELIDRYIREGINESEPEMKKTTFLNRLAEALKEHNIPLNVINEIEHKLL